MIMKTALKIIQTHNVITYLDLSLGTNSHLLKHSILSIAVVVGRRQGRAHCVLFLTANCGSPPPSITEINQWSLESGPLWAGQNLDKYTRALGIFHGQRLLSAILTWWGGGGCTSFRWCCWGFCVWHRQRHRPGHRWWWWRWQHWGGKEWVVHFALAAPVGLQEVKKKQPQEREEIDIHH